jgi:hypothetical protein
MRTFHSFEDMASVRCSSLYLPEAYDGSKIVKWAGTIERQLSHMLEEYEATRNYVYADKLRTFLKTWRENEITGSMNRETLNVLKSVTDQLAVEPWNLGNYFSNLRDQFRQLIASEEQLPRVATEPSDKMGGPGGGASGGSMPPLSPEFGPEGEAPGAGGPPPTPTPEEGAAPGEGVPVEGAPGEEGLPPEGEVPPGGPKPPRRPPRA